MKMSEAIRLGAMLKPQAFGTAFNGIGTCANGAARDAIGRLRTWHHIGVLFPVADEPSPDCPLMSELCNGFPLTIAGLIAHLNDCHRWTREQIADFVATVEQQQAVDAVREETDQPVVSTRVKASVSSSS